MRAGAASAAALRAKAPLTPLITPQHCSEDEYARFVETLAVGPAYRRQKLNARRRFVERWPDLTDWYTAPLVERLGRVYSEDRQHLTDRISYGARGYLIYLGLQGYLQLDYPWLLGVGSLYVEEVALQLGRDLGITPLAQALTQLDFNAYTADQAMHWAVGRIVSRSKDWITRLHQLQVGLFHRGQIAEQPRKLMPHYAQRPPAPPKM